MKKVKPNKLLPLTLLAGGLVMANYPLIKSMGQTIGTDVGTVVTDALPGSVDCWKRVDRDGSGAVRACSIKVNGIDEKCKVVTDVSYYDGLNTCVPVPPPVE